MDQKAEKGCGLPRCNLRTIQNRHFIHESGLEYPIRVTTVFPFETMKEPFLCYFSICQTKMYSLATVDSALC